jgi:hypothetical protein
MSLGLIWLTLSCAGTTNLTPAYLYLKPSVESYVDPDVNFSNYHTFSVMPFSILTADSTVNPILTKHLLFALRNRLEEIGYRFVSPENSPDIIATINASSEYQQSYIPPRSVTMPVWIPGQTSTTTSSTIGSVSAYGTGYDNSGYWSGSSWGTYSGEGTSTTTSPGHLGFQTQTVGGYTVGHHYPQVMVAAYDAKTLKNIWYGLGTGTSDNSDVRISGQLVLLSIIEKGVPATEPSATGDSLPDGRMGIVFSILTNDGNSYYPTVLRLIPSSPAVKAGLWRYDMITAIDGKPVLNRSFAEVRALMAGTPGSTAVLDIVRNSSHFTAKIKRVSAGTLVPRGTK